MSGYPWEVQGHVDEYGYAPTIGFVWTDTADRAEALGLARIYYGWGAADVVESRYGNHTPETGFVPK